MNFDEIREIAKAAITPEYGAYYIASNLNWLRYEKQLNELVRFIPKNSKILDIGCGLGMTVSMIKASVPDSEVIGIDITQKSTWEAYEKQFNVKYFVDDALNLQFNDEEFDIVVSFGVIEHVTDDKKFIKENLRILKSGGMGFILNIPNRYSMNEYLAKRLGLNSHDIRYNMQQIQHILHSARIKNFVIKRRFLIPAQVNRINYSLGELFNKFYIELDFLDRVLSKLPTGVFSQVFDVFYKKD